MLVFRCGPHEHLQCDQAIQNHDATAGGSEVESRHELRIVRGRDQGVAGGIERIGIIGHKEHIKELSASEKKPKLLRLIFSFFFVFSVANFLLALCFIEHFALRPVVQGLLPAIHSQLAKDRDADILNFRAGELTRLRNLHFIRRFDVRWPL